MKISSPLIITSRLLPGIRIGGVTVSIKYHTDQTIGRYVFYIDLGDRSFEETLNSSMHHSLQEGLESLLEFLAGFSISAMEYSETGHRPSDLELFPDWLLDWAVDNYTKICKMHRKLHNTPNLIEE